jgi:DNA gyrase/topoisomerase IV subunit A
MNYRLYIDIFTALLTPVIAIIALYIAYQQHKTNKTKLRHALYEKQLAFYKNLMEFIVVAKTSPITDEQMLRINPVTMEAEFFFGKDVSSHIANIQLQAITKRAREREKQGASSAELETLDRQIEEIEKWFHDQIMPTHKKFKKYLKLR